MTFTWQFFFSFRKRNKSLLVFIKKFWNYLQLWIQSTNTRLRLPCIENTSQQEITSKQAKYLGLLGRWTHTLFFEWFLVVHRQTTLSSTVIHTYCHRKNFSFQADRPLTHHYRGGSHIKTHHGERRVPRKLIKLIQEGTRDIITCGFSIFLKCWTSGLFRYKLQGFSFEVISAWMNSTTNPNSSI